MSLDDEPASGNAQPPPARQLSDARAMRALSHPVRIALIEMLSLDGPMTATEVGERIGESPTTCSFHLRQLARYGFVEEAGGGKGRARPWRLASQSLSIRGDDPEAELAADVLAGMWRERVLDRYRTWLDTKAAYPSEWRAAAGESEFVFYLTAKELKQLRDKVWEMLAPLVHERLTDRSQRPPGSVPVEMLLISYPLSPPAGSTPAETPPAPSAPTGTPPAGTSPAETPRSTS